MVLKMGFKCFLQVQKNCMMALCSDYILQDVPFDKFVISPSSNMIDCSMVAQLHNPCTHSTEVFFHQIMELKHILPSKCLCQNK